MTSQKAHTPHWGKHRGKVVDNVDNKGLGRIQVKVPGVAGDAVLQALPCTPYAGPRVGFLMIPPKDANVWIEFEDGDINKPIWSGCFWGDGQKDDTRPPTDSVSPDQKVLQTEKMVLILDDQKGMLTAKLKEKSSKGTEQTMSLTMDKNAIVLTAQQVTITITPAKIELKKGTAIIEVTDNIILKQPPVSIEITSEMKLKAAAVTAELSQSAINLNNGASSVAMSPASINLNKGALEIM